ncbi:MAG: PKD domain-containing protein [Flavobacteriales bacterium]|nr:PKD domain-containing protein [Flavobacteriales bacterium]
MTKNLMIGSVSAIRIHPENENIVIFSAANDLYRTTDGGVTWEIIGQPSFVAQNISAWEIAFNSADPQVVYAATETGFFRSADGGDNWDEILTNDSQVVQFQPGDPMVVYTVQHHPDTDEYKFYKSTDGGVTFTMYDEGWFEELPGYQDVNVFGARLAVSEADPDRIYALIVGYGEYDEAVLTNGFIGIWVSYDAGLTWSFPHDIIGTPYSESHPNLMNFVGDDGDYSQILYNTTMVASQLDADKVLIGGLNLWRSDDACATFQGVGGYIGGIPYFHVDQQELKIYKTGDNSEEIWCSNDGGICYSTDFMQSVSNRCNGIMAVNLWGYDQGWNEDIMVGGRYHNGNMGYHENYPQGEFLALGGGEAPTGYVNYSDENKVYFSDIAGRILPESIDGAPGYFSMSLTPNESYWFNNSSRIMADHHYFDVVWLGRENKLYRSVNGGSSYSEYHAFGTNANNQVFWFEQSYADPDYMYVHQRVGSTSKIWKTSDGGDTWAEIDLPSTLSNLFFDVGSSNPNELWVGYTYANDGFKIYHTEDAGENWDNITTPLFVGREIWGIAHQYGTNGGVYVATLNGDVLYRNNSMTEWVVYSDGLPISTQPIRLVPFYKENKIRLATWNLGVWEAPLYEPSVLMADFAAEFGTFFCPGDPVHFVDHSVCSAEATYQWSFPGAIPPTSTEKYPTVVYNSAGSFDVTMTVTDNGVEASVTKTMYISSQDASPAVVQEDFEAGTIPEGWQWAHSTGGNGNWTVSGEASAYGEGSYAMFFDNYWYDAQGNRDEIWLGKSELTGNVTLEFDVAYAPYGGQYSDTLGVYYSTDCGDTWHEVFLEGGEELSTAPANGNPFVPASDEWEHITLQFVPSLDAESDEIIYAFQNRGYWGNYMFVDNINISPTVSITETNQIPTLSVYPNPSEGNITIAWEGMEGGELCLLISDVTGRWIIKEQFAAGLSGQKIMDLSAFPSGLYHVQLFNQYGHIVKTLEKR